MKQGMRPSLVAERRLSEPLVRGAACLLCPAVQVGAKFQCCIEVVPEEPLVLASSLRHQLARPSDKLRRVALTALQWLVRGPAVLFGQHGGRLEVVEDQLWLWASLKEANIFKARALALRRTDGANDEVEQAVRHYGGIVADLTWWTPA